MVQRVLAVLWIEPRSCLSILPRLSDCTETCAFLRLWLFCHSVEIEINLRCLMVMQMIPDYRNLNRFCPVKMHMISFLWKRSVASIKKSTWIFLNAYICVLRLLFWINYNILLVLSLLTRLKIKFLMYCFIFTSVHKSWFLHIYIILHIYIHILQCEYNANIYIYPLTLLSVATLEKH